MATIGEFFGAPGRKKYVAAQQNQNTEKLYYYESDSLLPIPPSVHVWAHTKVNNLKVYNEIMTNYPKSWVSTYSAYEHQFTTWAGANHSGTVKIDRLNPKPWSQFDLSGLGAPPGLTGLYEDQATYGVSRARRVYLLAAFAKMRKYGKVPSGAQGHNIGSLLTDDSGQLLSWGMNTGGFCHAEVNTILGYFARFPGAAHLPAKSVLFTTLKPCQMCSTLIIAAQNDGSKVKAWYGMSDEGKRGNSPLMGDRAAPFISREKVAIDFDFDVMANIGMTDQSAVLLTGTQRVNVGTGRGKVDLNSALDASGGGHKKRKMSAADWTDKSPEVWALVEASVNKLRGKADRPDREDGPMKAALAYLRNWAL